MLPEPAFYPDDGTGGTIYTPADYPSNTPTTPTTPPTATPTEPTVPPVETQTTNRDVKTIGSVLTDIMRVAQIPASEQKKDAGNFLVSYAPSATTSGGNQPLIILAILLLIGGGGYFGYKYFIKKRGEQ